MYELEDEKVVAALAKASMAVAQPGIYAASNFAGAMSIDALFEYVQSKQKFPIEMLDVAFDGTHISARLERFADRTRISLRSDQTTAWKRFIATKELMHLIIDDAEDMSPYGNHRLEHLVQSGLIGLATAKSDTPNSTQSEHIAEIAAIEAMFPTSSRAALLPKNKGEKFQFSVPKLALERNMPEYYVSTALHPDFVDYISEALNGTLTRREARANADRANSITAASTP